MRLLRWLFFNIFLILLVIAAIYCYAYWGNLAGRDTPVGQSVAYLSQKFEGVDEFVRAVQQKQVKESNLVTHSQQKAGQQKASQQKTSHQKAGSEEKTQKIVSIEKETTPPQEPTTKTKKLVEQPSLLAKQNTHETSDEITTIQEPSAQGHEIVKQQTDNRAVNNNSVKAPELEKTLHQRQQHQLNKNNVAVSSNKNLAKEQFVSTQIQQQLNNVGNNGRVQAPVKEKVIATDNKSVETKKNTTKINLSPTEIKNYWIGARKAFYQKNYQLSEQLYQKIIDNIDDNEDAYGELGNVYFVQNKRQLATTAYLKAATVLLKKEKRQGAQYLWSVLNKLDKNKADELQKLMKSAPLKL